MSTGRGTARASRAVLAVGLLGAMACGSAGGGDLFEPGAASGGTSAVGGGTGGVSPSGGTGGGAATSGTGATGGVAATGGAAPAGGTGGAAPAGGTGGAAPTGGAGGAAPAGGTGGAAPAGGAGGAGGSSGAANPMGGTGGTGGCDFDRQTGPCADLRCELCNDGPGDEFCGKACQAIIDCVASQPTCSTNGDPLCVIRHTDGMPSECTAQAEMAGGYQSEPVQWALSLHECLCSP